MHVLMISPDTVGEKMAGPGIRYFEIAQILSREFKVTLAVPNDNYPSSGGKLTFCRHDQQKLLDIYQKCDTVICQGIITKKYPFLLNGGKPLVIDLYDIFYLEELAGSCMLQRNPTSYLYALKIIQAQLKHGDFFICASERQRDFWLGMLTAAGRINPFTFQKDPTLRNLIALVPFGLPSKAPQQKRKRLKGSCPQIGRSDKIILWAGGIWDWLDPFTPIKAMSLIAQKRNDVKLFFMGTRRPLEKAISTTTLKAVTLSRELQLLNRIVFFNDGWVPYEQRQDYLLDADIGITTYQDSLETHFSWRTRLLDYIWAGLPVVCNSGDSLSQFIQENNLGLVLSRMDERELAGALLFLLNNRNSIKVKRNIVKVRPELIWEKAVGPLVSFCRNPRRANDRQG